MKLNGFKMFQCFLLLVLIGMFGNFVINDLSAAERLKVQIHDLDTIRFPIVSALVSVVDHHGASVDDLNANNFRIRENGMVVPSFHLANQPGINNVVILLDVSESAGYSFRELQETAFQVVSNAGQQDYLALVTFSDKIVTVQDFTRDHYKVGEAVFQLKTAGPTRLYDGLLEAGRMLRVRNGSRSIVLISDGRDENIAGNQTLSRSNLEEALYSVVDSGSRAYVYGVGSERNDDLMMKIASYTGGIYLSAASIDKREALVKQALRRRRRMYKVLFESLLCKYSVPAREVEFYVLDNRQDIGRDQAKYTFLVNPGCCY